MRRLWLERAYQKYHLALVASMYQWMSTWYEAQDIVINASCFTKEMSMNISTDLRESLIGILIDFVIRDISTMDKDLSRECSAFLARQWDLSAPVDEVEGKTILELIDRMYIDACKFCDGWNAGAKEKGIKNNLEFSVGIEMKNSRSGMHIYVPGPPNTLENALLEKIWHETGKALVDFIDVKGKVTLTLEVK